MSMNDDIKKYPVYFLAVSGDLMPCSWIKSTQDYDHFNYNLHHYILKGWYKTHKKWCEEHGVKQKLIFIPSWLHKEIHEMQSSDVEFERKNHISRWELLFNQKHSKY